MLLLLIPEKVIFVRLDKSIDPVELVHRLCAEAQTNPETKKSRYVKRMTPVTEIRKTLSVDLEAFAREILKPHFHSGGPPKKVSDDDLGPASVLVPLRAYLPILHPGGLEGHNIGDTEILLMSFRLLRSTVRHSAFGTREQQVS